LLALDLLRTHIFAPSFWSSTVASTSTSASHRATFFGPYRHLLGVGASGWSACFEECLTESFLARELEDEFKGLETSDNELCCLEEFDAMAGKT
jgi:hypothetical protein